MERATLLTLLKCSFVHLQGAVTGISWLILVMKDDTVFGGGSPWGRMRGGDPLDSVLRRAGSLIPTEVALCRFASVFIAARDNF